MIRKVPNMKAWIMKWVDIISFERVTKVCISTVYTLPLFDTYPRSIDILDFEDDQLILIIDTFVNSRPFTLEQIEEINKTWNKFYE